MFGKDRTKANLVSKVQISDGLKIVYFTHVNRDISKDFLEF